MHTEIPKPQDLIQEVFSVTSQQQFEKLALAVFQFQYYTNPVYQSYCNLLKCVPAIVQQLTAIPFLPISFFKTHTVTATVHAPEVIFESSGTTGSATSRHLVPDASVYKKSFCKGFELFYGPASDYCIIGLLPSYLERSTSSLVYMVADLIKQSNNAHSGFYLYDFEKLAATLKEVEVSGKKTILIGVTYALLDFAEKYPMPLSKTIIMETGGMKGRKKEVLRQEVHQVLTEAFSVKNIHSEYGMTELLSQAYAVKDGRFYTPPWMQVLVRDEDDPLSISGIEKNGGINVIDLANIYSCSFIATEDVGRLYSDGSFEVLGRLDNAAIRGCSLLFV